MLLIFRAPLHERGPAAMCEEYFLLKKQKEI